MYVHFCNKAREVRRCCAGVGARGAAWGPGQLSRRGLQHDSGCMWLAGLSLFCRFNLVLWTFWRFFETSNILG